MFSLIAPILGMLVSVTVHIMAWRTIRPQSPPRLLPVAALIGGLVATALTCTLIALPTKCEAVEALLLFGAMVSAYLISLPALEAESPSSLIVRYVDVQARAGATKDDLATIINDETFIVNRIHGLEADGLIENSGGRLQLTPAGRTFLRGFMAYYHLAGRQGMAG